MIHEFAVILHTAAIFLSFKWWSKEETYNPWWWVFAGMFVWNVIFLSYNLYKLFQ